MMDVDRGPGGWGCRIGSDELFSNTVTRSVPEARGLIKEFQFAEKTPQCEFFRMNPYFSLHSIKTSPIIFEKY
jgi:hypothetical protein